jgi:hypothetical protein
MKLSMATPPVNLRRNHLTKVLPHPIICMRHHGNSGRARFFAFKISNSHTELD